MRLHPSAILLIAAPLLAVTACSSSQQASDTATSTSAAAATSTPTSTPSEPGCIDSEGHGPDNGQPCEANPADGRRVPLGTSTGTKVLVPADAYMAIYAPADWAAGIACTVTDGNGQPLEVRAAGAGAPADKQFEGRTWTVAATYGATPGDSTVKCAERAAGSVPTDQGPLWVRVLPIGLMFGQPAG
ncbi:hypothetical protein [Nocardia yamanashiensis]|uniref:hypothetical protein n=1 Tax=Nocardia yamanashiensis TaxID=209247 RepID=UPI000AE20581|nr:hypothetical protein [Nocardia yamanashiensis]